LKFLITGLGNFGPEYIQTRHNAGFMILDAYADASGITFEDKRFAFVGRHQMKGRSLVLIKPTTFVNLSGRAVHYWLKKEHIPLENLLVVVDDLALPAGTIRLRPGGGDGGHNGLAHINQILGTHSYARLRFGIGNEFSSGKQVSYVLGTWTGEEEKILPQRISLACEVITSFVLTGIDNTMNRYNNR
jgi:PTH1 family peptidyl-tRNA hydrolase